MGLPRSLSYAEARRRVLSAATPAPPERLPLAAARGRALRETLRAAHALPPFDNSSMDGFAVRAADLAAAAPGSPVTLEVTGVLPAGRVAATTLLPGTCLRIMTGAMIPPGADAVVAFEDCEPAVCPAGGPVARFRRPAGPFENIRAAGADLPAGAVALAEGRELSAHDLALLAALGVPQVAAGARPRAAVLSTGDELLEPHEPLRPGAVRDSNVTLLVALLGECGCEVTHVRRLPDDAARVAAACREALERADVVITIGGVSAGDFDPVRQALGELGPVESWRVAMKPGRPQAFGTPGGRLFFGLPGNPASVACVFEALVRPALRRRQGFAALDRPRLTVRAAEAIESRAGRTDFVRVELERRGDTLWAAPAGSQVSGHLTPQARAHALLIVPEPVASLGAGAPAEALLLRWPDPPG